MATFDDQPINSFVWVPRETLKANSYNPNKVAPPELRLLKISILEDGWTQPIVVREDYEIVDGFHRWTVSGDKKVWALTDGHVPIVMLKNKSPEEQRMATIRHNRARGTHAVVKMADIVTDLAQTYGMATDEIERRLQMDDEEVDRLLDHGSMVKRGAAASFGAGWVPE